MSKKLLNGLQNISKMDINQTLTIDKLVELSFHDGILYAKYNDCKIDINAAKKLVSERKKITQGISYPTLITSCERLELTKEARVFLSSKEGTEGLKLIALVHENSKITIMLINFMLKMHPPHIPIKSFENKEKALHWINSKN